VADSCKRGDGPLVSGATELVVSGWEVKRKTSTPDRYANPQFPEY
jgi:hypothetical protein